MLKTIMISLALVTAGVAPVAAEGLPNPIQTYLDRYDNCKAATSPQAAF